MTALHLLVVLMPALGALAMFGVALYAFSGPAVAGRRSFGVFAALVGLWTGTAALEFFVSDFGLKRAFGQGIYLGAATCPVAWLVFSCRYAGLDRWLTSARIAALAVLPAVTVVLALSNELHGLIWRSVNLVETPLPDLEIEHGSWFRLVHVPYSYGLFLLGLAVLLSRFLIDLTTYRRQLLGLLVTAIVGFLANFAYTFGGVSFYGLDPSPLIVSLLTVGLAISLFRGFLTSAPLSYREVFMATDEAVLMLDRRDGIVDINAAGAALAGSGEVRGMALLDAFPWLSGIDGEADDRTFVHEEGRVFAVRRRLLTGSDGATAGAALLLRDATSEWREREMLETLARLDGLTQTLNRGAFRELLHERLDNRPDDWPLALLFIDLDGFKAVNDSWGHAAGDRVLRETARRLQAVLRPGDVLGRIGGDEFAVLLPRADGAIARRVVERVASVFRAPFAAGDEDVVMSASTGYAAWPEDGRDTDALLAIADERMYETKRSGGRHAPRESGAPA